MKIDLEKMKTDLEKNEDCLRSSLCRTERAD